MTVGKLFNYIQHKFSLPKEEVHLILKFLLGYDLAKIYRNFSLPLPDWYLQKVIRLLKKRVAGGIPLPYILGQRHFRGVTFFITSDVLIPRWETELLVEEVINWFTEHNIKNGSFLEIGVGGGVVSLSIMLELPFLQGVGVEVSKEALEVANINKALLGVTRLKLLCGSMFAPIYKLRKKFNLIVANLPYIDYREIKKLPSEVKLEPRLALWGGKDGLAWIKELIVNSPKFLKLGGAVVLEAGLEQIKKLVWLPEIRNNFRVVKVTKDFSGKERILTLELINGVTSSFP